MVLMGDMGNKFNEVLQQVWRDDENKRDQLINIHQLRMSDTGGLITLNGTDRVLAMSDHALSQIFSRLGIPVHYGKRLMAERPDLVAKEFNHWVRGTEERLLLMRYREGDGDGMVRAFLSDKYAPLDNRDVSDMLARIVQKMGDETELSSFYMDDRRLHVRMTFPSLTARLGESVTGEEDDVRVGVDIVNSEVGASALTVTPLIWRLVCSNGLRAWATDGETFRQRHIHLKPWEIYNRMTEAVGSAVGRGDEMIEQFIATRGVPVDDPLHVIEKLSKKELYSKEIVEEVKNNFMIEPQNTVYGLVNAYTRTARELPNERRMDMERLAGRLMTDDLLKEFVA